MYSFVINKATELNKGLEPVNTIPMLAFINDIVELLIGIADPDPIKVSVINNNIVFFLNS